MFEKKDESPEATALAEQRSLRRVIIWAYLATALGGAVWFGLVFVAPYLKSRSSPWAALVYALYSPVCHQIPSRCFHLFGQPLAACARCLGIYSGFLVGLGIFPLFQGFRRLRLPRTATFLFVSAPIVFDTLGNFVRLWTTPNSLRFATGLLWGTILPFYFVPGIADLFLAGKYRLNSRRRSS